MILRFFILAFLTHLSCAQVLPRYYATGPVSSKIKLPDSLRSKPFIEVIVSQSDGSVKKGISSSSGKIIVPVIHDSLIWVSAEKGYITGRPIGDTWAFGLRNPKGVYVLEEHYAQLQAGTSLLLAFPLEAYIPENKEQFQLFDFTGKRIPIALCDSARMLSNGDFLLYHESIGRVIRNDANPIHHNIKSYEYGKLIKYPEWELKISDQTVSFWADSISAQNDSLVALKRGLYWGVQSLKGKLIVPFAYDSIYCRTNYLFLQAKSKTSIANLSGEILIPPASKILLDSKGYFHVSELNQGWKIANHNGVFLSDSIFNETGLVSNALLAAKRDSLWGYMHVSGKWQIQPKYHAATDFRFGYALVEFPNKNPIHYALIDRNDSTYFKNQEAVMYYYGMITFRTCPDTLPGEPKTEMVYPFPPYRYEDIRPWISGYFTTHNGNLKGILNAKGKELVYCHQDTLYLPSEKDSIFLYKRKNGSFGISDKYGNRTLYTNFQFKEVEAFHNGLARYKDNGLFGFIDQYGNVRISPQYPTIGEYSGNHVQVMFRGKWGYLDVQEKIKIQPYYQETLPVKNNLAIVRQGKKWEFLSTETGTKINVTSYDKFIALNSGKFIVYKGKKLGLTNVSGREIIFPKYEAIYELTDSTFAVRRDGYYGVLDREENILVNFQYAGIAYHPFLKQYIVKKEPNPIFLSHEGQ